MHPMSINEIRKWENNLMPELKKGSKTSEWLDNLVNKIIALVLLALGIFTPVTTLDATMKQTLIIGALASLGISSGMYTYSRMKVKTSNGNNGFNGD